MFHRRSQVHDGREGNMDDVIIVGAGIGGLTLGLALHAAGIPCRIFEFAAEIKRGRRRHQSACRMRPRNLPRSGSKPALAKVAIATTDATFFNRFGQLIYQEPLGRAAGYEHPQFSIHRGDLQMVLLDAFRRARRPRPVAHQPSLPRRRAGRGRRHRDVFRRPGRRQPFAPCAAVSRSPATASIRRSASSSFPMKASRAIPASTCGAA